MQAAKGSPPESESWSRAFSSGSSDDPAGRLPQQQAAAANWLKRPLWAPPLLLHSAGSLLLVCRPGAGSASGRTQAERVGIFCKMRQKE